MATERQVQRTVALCMSIMNRYHDGRRSPQAKAAMVSEVQAVAAWVLDLDLDPGRIDERILRPVRAALVARYGHELGTRFEREFLTAFDSVGTSEPMILPGIPIPS